MSSTARVTSDYVFHRSSRIQVRLPLNPRQQHQPLTHKMATLPQQSSPSKPGSRPRGRNAAPALHTTRQPAFTSHMDRSYSPYHVSRLLGMSSLLSQKTINISRVTVSAGHVPSLPDSIPISLHQIWIEVCSLSRLPRRRSEQDYLPWSVQRCRCGEALILVPNMVYFRLCNGDSLHACHDAVQL